MNKINLIISSAYAAIITSVFVVVITISAELSPALKASLTSFSGHHWTSKSIFTALIFSGTLTTLYMLGKNRTGNVRRALISLLWAVLFGCIAISAFYTGHHFKVW